MVQGHDKSEFTKYVTRMEQIVKLYEVFEIEDELTLLELVSLS